MNKIIYYLKNDKNAKKLVKINIFLYQKMSIIHYMYYYILQK